MKALLFSGGIDSTIIAAWLRPDVVVTVDYGQQSAEGELRAASALAPRLNIRHEIIRVNCRPLGHGHLAGRASAAIGNAPEWWPYRNQLLITLCGMQFVTEGLSEIMIGTVAGDEVHFDGRLAFLAGMDKVMSLQEGAVRVVAPAATKRTEDLISEVPECIQHLVWTFSCHVSGHACGQCRGCNKHRAILESL